MQQLTFLLRRGWASIASPNFGRFCKTSVETELDPITPYRAESAENNDMRISKICVQGRWLLQLLKQQCTRTSSIKFLQYKGNSLKSIWRKFCKYLMLYWFRLPKVPTITHQFWAACSRFLWQLGNSYNDHSMIDRDCKGMLLSIKDDRLLDFKHKLSRLV